MGWEWSDLPSAFPHCPRSDGPRPAFPSSFVFHSAFLPRPTLISPFQSIQLEETDIIEVIFLSFPLHSHPDLNILPHFFFIIS